MRKDSPAAKQRALIVLQCILHACTQVHCPHQPPPATANIHSRAWLPACLQVCNTNIPGRLRTDHSTQGQGTVAVLPYRKETFQPRLSALHLFKLALNSHCTGPHDERAGDNPNPRQTLTQSVVAGNCESIHSAQLAGCHASSCASAKSSAAADAPPRKLWQWSNCVPPYHAPCVNA